MEVIKVIDLLNKIANGELENGTKFRDKYTQKEYVFKPNSYAGIYPPDTSKSDEDWLLTLHSGWFRLDQEVEVIEEDKFEYIDQIHKDDDIPQRYNSKIKNTNLTFTDLDRITWHKVNELIDEVNELRKVIYNFKNVEELDIDLYSTESGIRTAKKINEIIDKMNKE